MKNIIVPLALALVCLSSCGSLYLADKNALDNKFESNTVIKIADYIFSKDQVGDSLFNRLIQFGTFKHDSLLNMLVVDSTMAVVNHKPGIYQWSDSLNNIECVAFDTRLIFLGAKTRITVMVFADETIFTIGDYHSINLIESNILTPGFTQKLLIECRQVILRSLPKEPPKKGRQTIDLNTPRII